jgi:dTDP-glucose 4,6-dehydratase
MDHCQAIAVVLERGRIGEMYNIGSGIEADVETIGDIVLDTVGLSRGRQTYVPDRPGHDRRYLLDSTEIRTQLGWAPTIGFEEGLRSTVEWYRDNREGAAAAETGNQ